MYLNRNSYKKKKKKAKMNENDKSIQQKIQIFISKILNLLICTQTNLFQIFQEKHLILKKYIFEIVIIG